MEEHYDNSKEKKLHKLTGAAVRMKMMEQRESAESKLRVHRRSPAVPSQVERGMEDECVKPTSPNVSSSSPSTEEEKPDQLPVLFATKGGFGLRNMEKGGGVVSCLWLLLRPVQIAMASDFRCHRLLPGSR